MRQQTRWLVGLIVITVVGPAHAATYTLRSEVRIGQERFTTLYHALDQVDDSPTAGLADITDHGSFTNIAPGQGHNNALWSSRASAQGGSGYLRVYAEQLALLGGGGNKFSASHDMQVNGNILGIKQSTGNERVTPYFTTGANATMDDTITINPSDPDLLGEAGTLRVNVRMNGTNSYSQGFHERLFGGRIVSEAALRIRVGTFPSQLTRYDQVGRDLYWEYDSRPFADEQPVSELVTYEAPIVFGETYNLKVEMWVWALVNANGHVNIAGDGYALPLGMHTIIADFHNTATWDGVEVLDGEGAPIVASVMGADALDYSQAFVAPPAPELPPLAPVAFPGDADTDGDVDAFDLGLWQTQFGQTGDGLSADFDTDGDVDAFDLGIWQLNFGTGVVSVPEPASAALLALPALALVRRR